MACGILIHRPGTDPLPPAVDARTPNYQTTRKSKYFQILIKLYPQNYCKGDEAFSVPLNFPFCCSFFPEGLASACPPFLHQDLLMAHPQLDYMLLQDVSFPLTFLSMIPCPLSPFSNTPSQDPLKYTSCIFHSVLVTKYL